jgi:protein-L-isoaspartate(D-aspartate) O-methyltransferase
MFRMTQMVDMSEEFERAAEARNGLAEKLRAGGIITYQSVEHAFRTVPRERFVPAGTPLDVAYNADNAVATKTNERGVMISSISAPFIQARMIEQAKIEPGMSVLEIGSGGYNAALLAEVVGPEGRVVSTDIDPEVTDRASALLDATGYGSRVTVVLADAEYGVPTSEPFDRILVTAGAWDIPPGLLAQLIPSGVLVVPLRMNGITRVIAFQREGDHLTGISAEVAGFVAMQGEGDHPDQTFVLPDADGRKVHLRFDQGAPHDPGLLDGVLATERTTAWSGVTIPNQTSFADLHLWFACNLPGFCKLGADKGTEIANEPRWFPFGVAQGDSFAYLITRPVPEIDGAEFGVRAYGAHGEQAAAAMVAQIQAWDRQPGDQSPTFGYWPTVSDRTQLPDGAVVLEKTHGLVTISWPRAG